MKITIVFVYDAFRFEVWLSGNNKQVQTEYWKQIKESGWNQYHIVPTTKGVDSIIEYVLADDPDFTDLEALTRLIEQGTLRFIEDVDRFISD